MRKKKLLTSLSFLVCFMVFFGCTAAKEGQLQTKATDVGVPAGVKSPDVQKVNVGYIEDVTFDKLKGKERITLFVSRPSDFKVERISEETIMIKLADMFVPEDFRKKLGYDSSKIINYVLPLQKTMEGKKWAYFEIALKDMIPYSVKGEKKRIVVDFDVSALSYTLPIAVKKTPKKPSLKKTARRKTKVDTKADILAKGMPQKKKEVAQKYTGKKISLDFQDADIRSVFRVLAECGETNIIAGEDVKGKVTVYMKNVPWDQVLHTILDTNGLVMKKMGEIISVITLEKLQKDELMRWEGERDRKRAEDIHKVAERQRLVAAGRLRQISIEAKIVEATTSFSRELGIQWGAGYQGKYFGILGGTNPSTCGVTSLPTGIGLTSETLAVNFPFAVAAPSIGVVFGGAHAILSAQLAALEITGTGKIISSPKVTTLDKVKAVIKQGQEIPYAVYDSEGNRTIEFKDAALQLEVEPMITPDGRISMKIKTTNDYADWTKTNVSNENPPINTSSVESTIVVTDGDTIVVGGIYKTIETNITSGVPGLSKIPILGWLFKTDGKSKEKRELLIFITPKIIKKTPEESKG